MTAYIEVVMKIDKTRYSGMAISESEFLDRMITVATALDAGVIRYWYVKSSEMHMDPVLFETQRRCPWPHYLIHNLERDEW